jgi:DNA-nicking Smr family endonuclease
MERNMDFKRILEDWERRNPQSGPGPFKDDDAEIPEDRGEKRRRLLARKPDAILDLHGLTQDDAWSSLTAFFDDAKQRGLEKVLIVHGKGNHSAGFGPLKKLVKDFLQRCPQAGESGHNPPAGGGSGATWVLLKKT